ncbi:TPA: porin [Neisseria polysaccharea]
MFDNFRAVSDAEDKYKHEKPSKERYTVGASYSNAGFTTNVAYGHYKGAYSQNGASKSAQIAKVEGYYNGNNLFVGAGVQYAKGFETANKYLSYFTDGFNTYKGTDITKDAKKNEAVKVVDAAVTLGYKMGNVVPRVSYAHGWAAKGVGTGATYVDKFDQIVVGGDYNFSKRTGLRAQVAHLRVGGNTRFADNQKGKVERTAATLGMIHKF